MYIYTVGTDQPAPLTQEQARFLGGQQGQTPTQSQLQALYQQGYRANPAQYNQPIMGEELNNALTTFIIGALVRWLPSLLFSYEQVPIASNWKRLPKVVIFGTAWNVISALTIEWVISLSKRLPKSNALLKYTGMDPQELSIDKLLAMSVGGLVAALVELVVDTLLAQRSSGIRKPLLYPIRNSDLGEDYKTEKKKYPKKRSSKN